MRATLCDCPAILAAEARFLDRFPEYAQTGNLEHLRATDYARLNEDDQIYLDYTGAGLYADSQLRRHHELLRNRILGNPHSHTPGSRVMAELVDRCRRRLLAYFCASEAEYSVIFTANATAALKLVGESYPFETGGCYALTFDNHNSVNGIREFARARGASIQYVPLTVPSLRADEASLDRALARNSTSPRLFAYPAQSNFSGVQHPLEWIGKAQSKGWDVLLDSAAFVPSNRLDLSRWRPDFVTLSFYKMFGYPTGIGCLIARKAALRKLSRPWFAGGTITVASVGGDRYFLEDGPSAFEDGTLDYLGIPAVEIGLDYIEAAGIDRIHTRVRCLTAWLLEALSGLRHGNGCPAVEIYGPPDSLARGGTIAMNFRDSQGSVIDHLGVEERAARHRISLRSGCFCNPGAGEAALHLEREELTACFSQPSVLESQRFTLEDFRRCIDGKSTGAVRVSMGIASNFADVFRFMEFASAFVET